MPRVPKSFFAKGQLFAPKFIPKKVAEIKEEAPPPAPSGVAGGVIGGVPGGQWAACSAASWEESVTRRHRLRPLPSFTKGPTAWEAKCRRRA